MCHALIIEDEEIIADHIADLAEEAGATSVECADTEQRAVAAARRKKPDLIIADVKLASGTGPAAVVTIKAEQGAVPAVFVTASPETCIPCDPPDVVVRKPYRNQDLLRELKRRVKRA